MFVHVGVFRSDRRVAVDQAKNHYVNYGIEKIFFSLPKGWNVISNQDLSFVPGS